MRERGVRLFNGPGLMRDTESVRDVFGRLLEEYGTAAERAHVVYDRALECE